MGSALDTLDLQTADDKPKTQRVSVSKTIFAVEFVWTPDKPPQKPTTVADAATAGPGAAPTPTTANSAKTAPSTAGKK